MNTLQNQIDDIISQFLEGMEDDPDSNEYCWKMKLLETRFPPSFVWREKRLFRRRLLFTAYQEYSLQTDLDDDEILHLFQKTKVDGLLRFRPSERIYNCVIKHSMPSAVLACLIIEGNKETWTERKAIALFETINQEIERMGHDKFCSREDDNRYYIW